MTRPNTIRITRKIDDITLTAFGKHSEEHDGWYISVRCGKRLVERRGPVSDLFPEIEDMLNVALDFSPA